MTRRRHLLLLALACLSNASIAHAQSPAEDAIHRGVELRRERKDEEALAEFRRAYALEATPRARAQIALAEQALGRWLPAEEDLASALSAPGDGWIDQNRTTLSRALEQIRDHLGAIDVTSDVPGADLRVNEVGVGTLPRAVRVEAGLVRLEVSAPGHVTSRREIHVDRAVLLHEHVPLAPLPADGAPVSAVAPAPSTTARGDAAPGSPGTGLSAHTWGWFAAGTAGLLLATGAAGVAWRYDAIHRYDDNPQCPHPDRPASCNSLRSQTDAATVLAVAGFVTGAAMAVTATILFSRASKTSVAASPWVTGSGAGLTLGATF